MPQVCIYLYIYQNLSLLKRHNLYVVYGQEVLKQILTLQVLPFSPRYT